MDVINVKTCVVCNTEKRVDDFCNKYRESKQCNIKRVLKRHNNDKDNSLQKRRDKNACLKDLDNRLKAWEKNSRKTIDVFFVNKTTDNNRFLS